MNTTATTDRPETVTLTVEQASIAAEWARDHLFHLCEGFESRVGTAEDARHLSQRFARAAEVWEHATVGTLPASLVPNLRDAIHEQLRALLTELEYERGCLAKLRTGDLDYSPGALGLADGLAVSESHVEGIAAEIDAARRAIDDLERRGLVA